MYNIKSVDRETGIIVFVRDIDSKEIEINCFDYNDYRRANEFIYVEVNTGDIVFNEIPTRVVMGNKDNLIRRAEQWEFDKWHTTQPEFLNTHNAIVFNKIINS